MMMTKIKVYCLILIYIYRGVSMINDWPLDDLDYLIILAIGDKADFLPALEGRGFPSRGLIVPTIDSGLHLSFGGQSSGPENHSHLNIALGVWGYPPQGDFHCRALVP